MPTLIIREYTDPGCPWAFSAEPSRYRLRWLFGEEIAWHRTMVGLSERPEDVAARGFTPDREAKALAAMQRRFGMPIDPLERPRNAATMPACRAVVAARLHAPEREVALLRRLRVNAMAGNLLDAPETLALSAGEAGLDPLELERWAGEAETAEALSADMAAARAPSPAALALDHKLADAAGGRRYTCPSYEIARADGPARLDLPGFQPADAYEAAIANLAPELARRGRPESVEEVLAWAGEPLATAEVAAVRETTTIETREALARVARERPVGADGYWTLPAAATDEAFEVAEPVPLLAPLA
jgi:predicted DsbA family dithiol-disulfide isomerase